MAAAAQREEATERQRVFARQLEKDVENMEEKLGALERQVTFSFDGNSVTAEETTASAKIEFWGLIWKFYRGTRASDSNVVHTKYGQK